MTQAPKKKLPAKSPILPFGKRNYQIFLVGLAMIVGGFVALASGSITLAPILLVLGYCVVVPVGILISPKREEGEASPK